MMIARIHILIFLMILFRIIPTYAGPVRVAIFDYDIRPPDEVTVAKHIEKKLYGAGLPSLEVHHFSGEKNEGNAVRVLAELESEQYNLIITITSDAMAPAFQQIIKTPWLFTNVNNPKIFGIQDPKKPGRNRSGVTYHVPVGRQLELFQSIMGGRLKTIGLIFDAQSKSRLAEIGEFRIAASMLGMGYRIELMNTPQDLPAIAHKLIDQKVDGIILTSSDAVYDNVHLILDICIKQKIPIFSVHKNGVAGGAIAAYASDYFRMVDECLLPMALAVLTEGKNPGTMPVRSLKNPAIYLNATQAKKIGLMIPQALIRKAEAIY